LLLLACLLNSASPPQPKSDTPRRPEIAFHLGHTDYIYCMAISPDGKLVATGSADESIKLWDAVSGELKHTLRTPGEVVYSLAFSPDSSLLASASSNGGRNAPLSSHALLWVTATGKLRYELGNKDDY